MSSSVPVRMKRIGLMVTLTLVAVHASATALAVMRLDNARHLR